MSQCCFCEGCYLTPKKRQQENPKLGIHLSCYLEFIRTDSEIHVVLEFLQKNSGDIEILKESLKRIDDFWKRMERIKAFHKSLAKNGVLFQSREGQEK